MFDIFFAVRELWLKQVQSYITAAYKQLWRLDHHKLYIYR